MLVVLPSSVRNWISSCDDPGGHVMYPCLFVSLLSCCCLLPPPPSRRRILPVVVIVILTSLPQGSAMSRAVFVALLGLSLGLVHALPSQQPDGGKHWVLIVAGSNGWYNYRHQVTTLSNIDLSVTIRMWWSVVQISPKMKPLPLHGTCFPAPLTSVSCWLCVFQADACHAYQIAHRNGIPDEQIVVMMYDDLAQNEEWVDIFVSALDLCGNQTSLPWSVYSLASRAGAINCLISLIIDRTCISYFPCFRNYAHRLVFPALNMFFFLTSVLFYVLYLQFD